MKRIPASYRSVVFIVAIAMTMALRVYVAAQSGRGGAATELGDGPFDMGEGANRIHVVVVTKGLDHPWGMAFLPNGDMLVTNRGVPAPSQLRLVRRNGALEPAPIEGLPAIRAARVGGLFDVALHPKFSENQWVYLSYAKPGVDDPAHATTAIYRARWDGAKLVDGKDIFVAEPGYGPVGSAPGRNDASAEGGARDEVTGPNARCCGQGPSDGNFGSRLVFDRDGYLYATLGDRNWGEQSQETNTDMGKIIRLKDDGAIPADNPFYGRQGYRGEIYTLGHRNPLGLTFDPVTGRLWSTEFGPRGGDELNLIEKGKNYGWILVTNGIHYNQEPAARGNSLPGFEDPVVWWGQNCGARGGCGATPSGASFNPGNVAVYNGDRFPSWKGNLLVGMMGSYSDANNQTFRNVVMRIVLDSKGRMVSQTPILTTPGQRVRDVRVGPDGYVYVLTDVGPPNGALLRIEPGK